MSAPPPTLQQLLSSLTSASTASLPSPHPSFIAPILASSTSNPARTIPLNALTSTARHRILASDITLPNILNANTASLPSNVGKNVVEWKLTEDVFVQVLEIEDIGKSKWEQVQDLEAERKGERVKGREIIRVVNIEENEPSSASTQAIPAQGANQQSKDSKGPFKLLMQDWKGNKIWGVELRRMEKVGYPPTMGIGAKLWLKKGAKVARGMVLLESSAVNVVGGRIEAWDKKWGEGREEKLREEVKRDNGAGRT